MGRLFACSFVSFCFVFVFSCILSNHLIPFGPSSCNKDMKACFCFQDAASFAALKEAIASVLIDKLDDGALVSLVYFANGSSLHSGPVALNNASRSDITNRLLEVPMEGPTCTICGLRLTLQLLSSAHGQSSEGSLVVLFSDGKVLETPPSSAEENSDGFLAVVPDFQRAKVFITTVAVGATASSDLEKLAFETGGRTFAICDTNATAEKRSWMAVQDALLDTSDELCSEVDALRDESSALYYGTGNRRSSGLLEARTGLCFEDPITLRVRVPEYVDSYRTALVFASLTKGLCPVVRANVRGLAFFQCNRTGQGFLLHDSGLGEDVYADDGIYTGQLTKSLVKGRYSIAIEVSNNSQTQFLDWIPIEVPNGSPTVAGERASTDSSLEGVRDHSTGAFSKTSAEHPLFVKEDMKERHVPPGKVRDLRASFGSHEGRPTARLSWTMPGAHAFEGTVSSLDVRLSRSIQTMLGFFHNATAISERDLVSGSLSPLPAFSRQQATISIPSTVIFGHNEDQAPAVLSAGHAPSASGHNVYFALVTTNADGSHSEVSNLARVFVAANLTVPAGSATALAGAAALVPEEILVGKRDSESADTSLPTEPLTSSMSPPLEEPATTPEVATAPPQPPNAVTPLTEGPDTPESTTSSAEIEEESSDENTEPQETHASVPTTKKKVTTASVATAKETPASTWENEASSAQQPWVNATETDQNATTPPIAEKKEVNKGGQEEDDDGIFRAWILFGAFMVACLLICANLAFLYCRAQYEVDAGPPSPGPTSGYDTF
ncbi:calcium-activated chloride channel regulator 1-like [Dermacentor andersoni]|uniref:calcium-activated chloride channel regulator 1-like n=1 Tax=Dermacentor andersoni TaxID=34620 RepID=UPI002417E6AB|nr:uncharacterized protein LOC126536543 [Dermacentor andersoni]